MYVVSGTTYQTRLAPQSLDAKIRPRNKYHDTYLLTGILLQQFAKKIKQNGPKTRLADPSGVETQHDQVKNRTRNRYFNSRAQITDSSCIVHGI